MHIATRSILTLLLLSLASSLAAAPPMTINFQGFLADSAGTPISGQRAITFRLYDAEIGGNLLWTEVHPSVAIAEGVFSVQLGAITSLTSIDFDDQYWVTLEVATDGEMFPSYPLTAAPYACRSAIANDIENDIVVTSKIANDAITETKISNSAITTVKIADNAVTDQKISGTISGSKLGTHNHSGSDINGGTVDAAYIDSEITRDSELSAHTSRTDNPHTVTATQIGAAPATHSHNLYSILSEGNDASGQNITSLGKLSICTSSTDGALNIVGDIYHRGTQKTYTQKAMVDCSLTNGTVNTNEPLWQSFTVTKDTLLTGLAFKGDYEVPGIEIRMYAGEGTGGNLLKVISNYTMTTSFNAIEISPPLAVIVDEVITIELRPSGYFSWKYNYSNPYPGGQCNRDEGWDLAFKVFSSSYEDNNPSLATSQSGIRKINANVSGGIKKVNVNFPRAFTDIPKVNLSFMGHSDVIISLSAQNITTQSFEACLLRVDDISSGGDGSWSETDFSFSWIAWE